MKDYTNITELLVCVHSTYVHCMVYNIITTYILIRVCICVCVYVCVCVCVCVVCVCVCVFTECVLRIIVAFFSPQAKCILQNKEVLTIIMSSHQFL